MTFPCPHNWKLAVASAVSLSLHLPLLWIVQGEFTDGVLQAAYFDEPLYQVAEGVGPARYVPPLFPLTLYAVSEIGVDRITSGRVVSLAAYALSAFVLGWIATQAGMSVFGREDLARQVGWLAWAFWSLSPMANRWSFHCMSDMLFCLLATGSLACYLQSTRTGVRSPYAFLAAGNILGIAASFCRYQGLALLAASAAAWLFLRWGRRAKTTSRERLCVLGAWGLWIVAVLALKALAAVHGQQFADRAQFPKEVYLGFLLAALRYLPYAVTPPLFLLALWGALAAFRTGMGARMWIGLGVLGGLGGLAVQTLFQSFQFRYGLPLLPWVCVLGAVGAVATPKGYRWAAVIVTFTWLTILTGAVLTYQHKTFADLEKGARSASLASRTSGAKIWACEPYDNEGKYRNVKTSFWSGISVGWLDPLSLDRVAPGDILIDSNVYPIPPRYLEVLRAKWKLGILDEALSETIPLFPGEILWVRIPTPQGETLTRGTSDPNLMPFRFQRQFYSTVVYRIEEKPAVPKDQGV